MNAPSDGAHGGPLEGIKVLDFSTLLPGPFATLLLAEAGAQVIKLERPGQGDEMRGFDPPWPEDAGYGAGFALLNRGKRSIAVDLKEPSQRAALEPLLEEADVLVEQFRPGVMDRLGLGYAALEERNPRLIYCSITGYGQTGPKRLAAGHDLSYQGDVGLLALGLLPGAAPPAPPALVADIAGGSYPAVISILLALIERERTGRGTRLDVSMTDNLFPFMFWALAAGLAQGAWPGAGAALFNGGSPRYQLYRTADGAMVAVAPIEDRFWTVFCDRLGLAEDATIAEVGAAIAARPAEHWRALFREADCCCTVVASLEEALEEPHFRARGLFDREIAGRGGARLPALPVPIAPELRRGPGTAAAPELGQHNHELLSLGEDRS